MASAIEDYALIGDCETAALVGKDGSIDWLCWPRFDSEACFAALLGKPENGRWLIAPVDPVIRVRRRYRPGTLILETEFETAEGTFALIDFMVLAGAASSVVRLVEGRRGRVEIKFDLTLRFGYGRVIPWVTRLEQEDGLRMVAGPDMAVLRTPVALRGENLHTTANFMVEAGKTIPFLMTYAPAHGPVPAPIDPIQALSDTEAFWLRWTQACTYEGHWKDAVQRSLIVLKGLTYRPTGGIVAAPTTSLPEQLGGNRNWDYRACWLRDATLTLLSLMDAGYIEEAKAWREWLLRAVAGSPGQIQIMYGVGGERMLHEWELPWLEGYESSRPVRIGNDAYAQRQLDVFGEVMDAMHQARRCGIAASGPGWALQRALIKHLEGIWDQPDEGIWEVRGPRRHFTHSKIMAWVAVDRAIRSAVEFGLQGPVDHWRQLRALIHDDVCRKGFDSELGSFVQSYGDRCLDASLLLIPLVGFLPADDPRVQGTVRAIEQNLLDDGLVRRYDTGKTEDGLPPGEGAFLACSFWYADNLVLAGRWDDACEMFERLLELRNDVGLLAEEYDPVAGRQVGNFPQALSHLALIGTAQNLTSRYAAPAKQRSEAAGANGGQTNP